MLIPDCPNVTLVAFYGSKPSALTKLIVNLQNYLSTSKLIEGGFTDYQLEQVHGTVIGCEGVATTAGIVNKWFYARRRETRYIDFANLIKYFNNCSKLPLIIRFGGYDPQVDYGFLSRGLHPYERSFQLQS